MIFESLWPLFFLAAVPIIIILYLLKPRGTDHLNSSNLLWKKLLKNVQSRTFFEKFTHNILMYLQILIVALLVIALMAPFIRADGKSGERKILLLDTSGSMQHVGASGRSRLEEAVEQACEYVRDSEDARFCVVTADGSGVDLLAVDIADADSLTKTLKSIECSDCGGGLAQAQELLDTLAGDGEENAAGLLVYTDGAGAADFDALTCAAGKELHVVGEPAENVANEYTVYTLRGDGLYDVMVSAVNYSGREASFDVGLYDQGEKLIALSRMRLAPGEDGVCLLEQVDWQGQTLEARLEGISFEGGGRDSLAGDDLSYAVKKRSDLIDGLLVGGGNAFIEKAYQAVTSDSIARAQSDAVLENHDYNVVIYDADQALLASEGDRLVFGNARGEAVEELENVTLDMVDCDLTAGLSGFAIGVNKAYCFELPEGAESFLECDGKCVGYYGERDGGKEIVTGFDIRESDFPLRAEFPVFLANAMVYLSDTSWLTSDVYYAGEEIRLQPWADPEALKAVSRPRRAGLYQLENEEYRESYVVRFCTAAESDGRAEAASVVNEGEQSIRKVKRTLRNAFLILALAFLAVEWIVFVRQMRCRGNFYRIVRGAVFLCVLLALLGVGLRLGGGRTATVFVVDLSHSNEGHREEMEDYVKKTVAGMPSRNLYGIVTFGRDALVEQFLSPENHCASLMSVPEATATNFEEAISRALTMIPGDYGKRLVVLTDGKETGGDIRRMAQALSAGGTEFLTLLYEDEETQDAYIDQVTLPAYLHPGDKYSVTVLVESNYDTEAVIEIYNRSQKTAASRVHLNKGSNRFVLDGQAGEEAHAMENLRVQVRAEGDACPENDVYSAYSMVEAAPRTLVISGRNSDVSGFTAVLNAAGCDYSVVSTLNAPDSIGAMTEYRSIVLVDAYIDDLPQGFLDNLETYVKDYGCGFVCCGGEESFALGGYRDTVLETVLPVDMELRGVNEKPSMGMVMVIDRSSSMSLAQDSSGPTNLDIAIRAADVAVDNLSDSDYVGVLTFDDRYSWQAELTQADAREEIKEKIKEIDMGGGTTIKPALLEACRVLSQSDVSVKHVVLLTDGMGETTDFHDVEKAYQEQGITLSTVAVGEGSDTNLLEKLADSCGGRYYYSDVSSDIPRIFAQEVFLGGDSYIQNGDFALAARTGHELTAGLFSEGWPSVYGYVSATPKTASSRIIATVGKEDPILTVWQYGLGRTVAWNSDVTGEWSGAFAGREDYVRLWKRIIDFAAGNADMGGDRVNVATVGDETRLTYETEDYSGQTEIFATVIGPEGETDEVKLHAAAPGSYEAGLSTPDAGLYHFNIRREEDGEIRSYVTAAAAVQFSDEYRFDGDVASYLNFARQYGRVITPEEKIWGPVAAARGEKRPLTNWLLGLAICLFVADVAMRRFQYVPRWKWKKPITGEGTDREKAQPDKDKQPDKDEQPADKDKPSADGPKKPEKRKKKSVPQEQTLDTSRLLQKKDDRNI